MTSNSVMTNLCNDHVLCTSIDEDTILDFIVVIELYLIILTVIDQQRWIESSDGATLHFDFLLATTTKFNGVTIISIDCSTIRSTADRV